MAKTAGLPCIGSSLAEIAYQVRDWLDHGWTEGWMGEPYEQEHEEPPDVAPAEILDGYEVPEPPPRITSPRDQATAFRACLRDMVPPMVEAQNNLAVAYAMDKTGYMMTDTNRERVRPRIRRRWDEKVKHFESLTYRHRADRTGRVEQYMPLQEVPDAFDLDL